MYTGTAAFMTAYVGAGRPLDPDRYFTGDLFFPPEDIKADADRVPGAKYVETGTCWGHFTMFNLREQDTAAIDAIYAEALAS